MWTQPLGASVELPGGHETLRGYAAMGGVAPCGRTTGSLGGTPWGGTKRVRGVPKWAGWRHADAATGGLGGAPWGPRNV